MKYVSALPPAAQLSTILSGLLIGLAVLAGPSNSIGLGLVLLGLGGLHSLWSVMAIAYFLFRLKAERVVRAFLPFGINMSGLAIALLVVSAINAFDLHFRLHLNGYTQVIQLVEEASIQPNAHGIATLPPQYWYLSDGGSIDIYKEKGVTSSPPQKF